MQIFSITKEYQFSSLNNKGHKFYSPYFILIFKKDFILPPAETSNAIPHVTIDTIGRRKTKHEELLEGQGRKDVDNGVSSFKSLDCKHNNLDELIINNATIFLGFKVSRKVGGAVVRNKIKRRIRHLIKLCSNRLISNNYGIIIIPRSNFATIKFSVLIEQMYKILTPYFVK